MQVLRQRVVWHGVWRGEREPGVPSVFAGCVPVWERDEHVCGVWGWEVQQSGLGEQQRGVCELRGWHVQHGFGDGVVWHVRGVPVGEVQRCGGAGVRRVCVVWAGAAHDELWGDECWGVCRVWVWDVRAECRCVRGVPVGAVVERGGDGQFRDLSVVWGWAVLECDGAERVLWVCAW